MISPNKGISIRWESHRKRIKFVRPPKEQEYGMVAVFEVICTAIIGIYLSWLLTTRFSDEQSEMSIHCRY